MSKLNDKFYGIAYRNHRYDKDEYSISFYTKERDRDLSLSSMGSEATKLTFEFRPIDLIEKGGRSDG